MLDPFMGDLALLHDLEGFQCKGNWVAARHRYVRETFAPAVFDAVAGALGPRDRALFASPPLAFSWQPLTAVVAMDRAIVDVAMDGQVARMRDFGNLIARYDLPALYKVFFKLGTPGFVLGRAGLIYGQYLRRGRMRAETTQRSAVVTLTEAALPYYLCEHGISGWLEAAVAMSGGTRIRLRQARCAHRRDPACVWEADWQ